MVRITTSRLATRTGAVDHQRWQFQIVWEIKTRKLECRYIAASYCPIGLNVIRMIAFGRGNECDLCFKQAIRYGSGKMHLWLKGDDWRQLSTSSIKPGYNLIEGPRGQNVSTLQKFTAECSLSTLNGKITTTFCSNRPNATMDYVLKSNMTV